MASADNSHVWFVTGSSSGFGLHIAQAAVERGDSVVATARRSEALDELVSSAPDRVHAVALDVRRSDQIGAAAAAAFERFGRIDVLVNNAGYGSVGAVEELDMDDLRDLMDTMFFGAVELTKAVLPHMRERGSGAIVQMSSQGGQVTYPGYGAYCAAKYALEGLSEALAAEVEPLGIRVLIVEPGAFRTGLLGTSMHQSREIPAYAETAGATWAAAARWTARSPATPASWRPRSSRRSTRPTPRCISPWAPTRSRPSAPRRTGGAQTSRPGRTSAEAPRSTR